MRKIIFILSLWISTYCHGQISVKPAGNGKDNDLEAIINSLIGDGVTISNITTNLPGDTIGYGTFTEPSGRLGIKKGLVMTTGDIRNVPGPNNTPSMSISREKPGDLDLQGLFGYDITYDAVVIEFDIECKTDTLAFNYSFASEEYKTFVGTKFNDIFAFFISGPGIVGKKNLALIPGTETYVSINTVNHLDYPQYFIYNEPSENSPTPWYTQFNGHTTVFKAQVKVMPCKKYHLKFAIADGSDHIYDSGVFIEAGSLGRTQIQIDRASAPDSIDICSNQPGTALKVLGSPDFNCEWKINGAPSDNHSLLMPVTKDGMYHVKVNMGEKCDWEDSIKINLKSPPVVKVAGDTVICYGGAAILRSDSISPYSYCWSNAESLSSPYSSVTVAKPTASTLYVLTTRNGKCRFSDSVKVKVLPRINASIITGQALGEVPLAASFAAAGNGTSYHWTFDGKDTAGCTSITRKYTDPGIYTVTLRVTNELGCYEETSQTIEAYDFFLPNLITPNGDGLNDVFRLSTVANLWTVEIYNTWGNLVYRKENYRDEWAGEEESDNVYYYRVINPATTKEYTGWLHILSK